MLGTKHSLYYIFWQMEVKQMLKYVGYPKIGNLLGILQTFQVSSDTTVYEVIYSSIHMCKLVVCIIWHLGVKKGIVGGRESCLLAPWEAVFM